MSHVLWYLTQCQQNLIKHSNETRNGQIDRWTNRKHTKQWQGPYRKLVLHMHIKRWQIINQYPKWSYKCHDFLNQERHWHFQWRFRIQAYLSIGGSFRTKGNLECGGGGSYTGDFERWMKEGSRNGTSHCEGFHEGDIGGGLLY
jgi:hypothetical protein